jgi:arginyl-tRNA synthetase
MYIDLNDMVRYTALEGILHGRVTLIKDSYMLQYMRNSGMDMTRKFWYNDYGVSLKDTAFSIFFDADLRNTIINVQKKWWDNAVRSATSVWQHVLELK